MVETTEGAPRLNVGNLSVVATLRLPLPRSGYRGSDLVRWPQAAIADEPPVMQQTDAACAENW